ncbi:multiple epidermal growth factor-like domains protein 6 [Aplysia californica]|uniref:Multiple epidermal growth factor-like domains protein 6 n=1 Tax=Aplysia californica TaxID=6500 RepID=A0ABM1W3D2_APLCA|nr:multiple epidermal growth factor-like domains protein 6 [Aplysia californica]
MEYCFTRMSPAWVLLTCLLCVMSLPSARAGLDDVCSADADCQNVVANSVCRQSVCHCAHGFMEKAKNRCKRLLIDDPCREDSQCLVLIEHSECLSGVCQCLSGHKPKNTLKRDCVQRRLGDLCKDDKDCNDVIDNSVCYRSDNSSIEGVCACGKSYRVEADGCVIKSLGDQCIDDQECTMAVNNSRCLQNTCVCNAGYKNQRNNNTVCLPLELDDSCLRDEDCEVGVANSVCSSDKTCVCKFGFFSPYGAVPQACIKRRVNDPCMTSSDCKATVPRSRCINRKCTCGRGVTPSANMTSCRFIELHDVCGEDADCMHVPYSSCLNRRCYCQKGHREYKEDHDFKSTCIVRVIGDVCRDNDDCGLDHSLCDKSRNKCVCETGFLPVDSLDQCRERRVNETSCSSDEECQRAYNHTICKPDPAEGQTGVCQCDSLSVPVGDGTECIFSHIGDRCGESSECSRSVANSKCDSGVCRCQENYTPSDDVRTCHIRTLGGLQCSQDSECLTRVANSVCEKSQDGENGNATCACAIGYKMAENRDKCLPKGISDPCQFDADCETTNPNSHCSWDTFSCQCLPGYTVETPTPSVSSDSDSPANRPVCSQRKLGHQLCASDYDCSTVIANSKCGSCGESPPGSQCRRKCASQGSVSSSQLDSTVVSDAVTSEGVQINPGSCTVETCVCREGFLAVGDWDCRGRLLGDRCDVDSDCSGHLNNSLCVRGACYCAVGYKVVGRTLCTPRTIGDSCGTAEDCSEAVNNSHCHIMGRAGVQGTCECDSGYRAQDSNRFCSRRLIGDDTCKSDVDCSEVINGSFCHYGVCVCLQGYVASTDLSSCSMRRLNSDICSLDIDCTSAIDNSKCKNFRCACALGFYARGDNECVKRKIGERNFCRFDEDCSQAINNSTCSGGVCRCVSGFHPQENGTRCEKRRIYDKTCSRREDCADSVAHSLCEAGRCVCRVGYLPRPDRTLCVLRTLGVSCAAPVDCSAAVRHSSCVSGRCRCQSGYVALANNTKCGRTPTQIGAECFFSHQCEQLDPLSTCNKTHGNISTCVCPEGTFRGRLRSSCVPLPTKVKDECTYNLQCLQSVAHSYCDGQCACLSGYFSHLNGTQCQPEPRELGEVCGSSRQCERAVDAATCDSLTNTCVCQFGYEREEPTYCRKRQLLPTYEPLVAPPPASCHKTCETWTNSMCVYTGDGSASKCQCLPRHAHRTNRTECVPVQTYNLTVHLTHEADLYDYVPLVYWPDYQNVTSPLYQELVDRVTLNGMARLFERTRLNRRYVSSEVTRLDHPAHTEVTRSSDDPKIIGVRAKVLLHLSATYLDALSLQDISSVLWKDLNRFYGELGQSRLKVKMPASEGVSVHDEDECAVSESNDCSPKATSLNTLGSYITGESEPPQRAMYLP